MVERDNQTIVKGAKSMWYYITIPLEFRAEAVNTVVFVLNRIASRTLDGKTPYELWLGEIPDISHFRIFGSLAYAHIPKQIWRKLDSK